MNDKKISRGRFLSYSAVAGAAGVIGVPAILSSCGSGGSKSEGGYTPIQSGAEIYIPDLKRGKAVDGRQIKAGVIGCGGRGSGAALNFLDSANDVTITAIADLFLDKSQILRESLGKDRGIDIAADQVYNGFDAYKNLIDNADIDMVIIATPTLFHPTHMKYALDNGKHVFVEKPAAVDAVGCRTVLAACKVAESKRLSVVTGTQYHHSPQFVESCRRIRQGMIGDIVSGNCYYNQGAPWYVTRKPGWSDIEYMIRDFFSWYWLSGDYILDQCIHYIDVFGWITNLKPVSAVGMGARARRTTGNIYDFITADLVYEGGVHCNAQSRQIDDCANNHGTFIFGTKGSWNTQDFAIRDLDGNILWQWNDEISKEYPVQDPYTLEHADLVTHIRQDDPICLADVAAYSAAMCNMARESAYSGKEFTYDEFINSDLNYMPEDIKLGPYPGGMPAMRLPGRPKNDE